jgi:hypothetical protein
MPANYDLEIFQGDTYTLVFEMDGAYDYANGLWVHEFQMKENFDDVNIVISKSTGNGITTAYDPGNQVTTVQMTLSPTVTAALDATKIYRYDYQIKTLSPYSVTTLLNGEVRITPEIVQLQN